MTFKKELEKWLENWEKRFIAKCGNVLTAKKVAFCYDMYIALPIKFIIENSDFRGLIQEKFDGQCLILLDGFYFAAKE